MKNTNQIFGNSIHRSFCEHHDYYTSPALLSTIDQRFALPEIRDRRRGHRLDIMIGDCDSIEENQSLAPTTIPEAKNLIDWIVSKCAEVLGDPVRIDRSAMNRMYFGCEGICHNHMGYDIAGLEKTPDLVGIFYIEAGSDLIIINNGKFGSRISDIETQNQHPISPKTGELILHGPDVWHAIARHESVIPRTCFAFHFSVDL